MSLKKYLDKMDGTHRQAFLELERMIYNSKMECISAIPKTRIYDDKEINIKIEILQSKIDKLEKFKEELMINKIKETVIKNKPETIELSGKEQLMYMVSLANIRYLADQSFTDEEVMTLFGAVDSVFGSDEASGFLNLCLETLKTFEAKNRSTFNKAVVHTVAKKMSKIMLKDGQKL